MLLPGQPPSDLQLGVQICVELWAMLVVLPAPPRPRTRPSLDQYLRPRDRAPSNAQWRSMWKTVTAEAAVKWSFSRPARRRTARARPPLCSAEGGETNAAQILLHVAEPPLARQEWAEGRPRPRFAGKREIARCPHRRRYSVTTYFRLAYMRPEGRSQTRKAHRWCLLVLVTADSSPRRAEDACVGGGPRHQPDLHLYGGPPRRQLRQLRIAKEKGKAAALPAK